MTSPLDELRAYLRARDDAEPAVTAHLRSQLLAGEGDEAVILLHGLTASPPAWGSIAAALNITGATVVVLRLPLHGHRDRLTTALRKLSADLLTDDLRAVVAAVARLNKRIVIGGHSLGGTLAIHAAAMLPQVDRIVAVAPFLGVAGLPQELHRPLIPFIRALPNLFLWWDPIVRERQQPEHGYPRYPLHALAVGIEIADAVCDDANRAPQAHAIDLVINAQESSVNNRAVRRLGRRWSRASAPVIVHQLMGLPPSHDIIEPARANSLRVRDTLVRLLLGEPLATDGNLHTI
jgi:pimeloyl-ACP methyl ester carboxylesterase